MSGTDNRRWSSDGPHSPEATPHGYLQAATPFLLGIVSLALVTLAAFRLNLQPGSTSFSI